MIDTVYTTGEVARMLKISPHRAGMHAWRMPVGKHGNRYLWTAQDIERLKYRIERYETMRGNRQPAKNRGDTK